MLKKLLKYDFKWVYKLLIVFYVLSILFSILGRVFFTIGNSTIFNIVAQVCLGFAVAMMINCLINNMMRMWVRFIRNDYKDESYLTHTLPIKKGTIYLSKVICAIVSMLLSVLVVVVSLAICFYSKENIEGLKNMLAFAASSYETSIFALLASVFSVFFLEMVFAVLAGFLGIIVGHQSNYHKMAKSIIYGFLFYLIPQIVTLLLIFIIGLWNQEVMNLFVTSDVVSVNAMKIVMGSGIVIYLIYNAIYYWIGKKQFEKGVNVD